MKKQIFNIDLPVPETMNPLEKLSYDAHNKAALKNFDAVGRVLRVLIENQKNIENRLMEIDNKLKEETKDDE